MKAKKVKTSQDIVYDLENEAENQNYHSLCEMYQHLREVLLDKVGEEKAAEILLEIKNDYNGFLP